MQAMDSRRDGAHRRSDPPMQRCGFSGHGSSLAGTRRGAGLLPGFARWADLLGQAVPVNEVAWPLVPARCPCAATARPSGRPGTARGGV